ncbi:MAG: DJ-1/PfpI family protein, partial [Acutalibacteraceae bacterium]
LDASVEAVILPGGMPGTLNLEKSETVQSAIDFAAENKKLICAICAAPSILGHKNLLAGREAIAYPGFEKDLYSAKISESFVVKDENFITAKGAGVAVDFGLEIAAALYGKEKSDSIRSSIQCI